MADVTGHPEISSTFHFPCHYCGQAVEVVDAVRQPHECRTYETDAERICAAYWAGYERAQPNELRVAALAHAVECYAGPDDDTLPVLRHWLATLPTPEASHE